METLVDVIIIILNILIVIVFTAIALLSIFASLFGLAEISWWIISGEFFHFIQPIAAAF